MSEAGFHSGTEGIHENLTGQYSVWLCAVHPEGFRNFVDGSNSRRETEACSGAAAIPGNTVCYQPSFFLPVC